MAKKTSIGGQAIIEGVMMRSPKKMAIAVRQENGEIYLRCEEKKQLSRKNKFLSLPFIRGVVALVESFWTGMQTLMESATIAEGGDINKKSTPKEKIYLTLTLLVSLLLSLVLFSLLPTIVADILKHITQNSIIINLFEGLIKVIIFLGYIYFIGKMEDIKRQFQYHGAEHKTIFCYEAGEELTVENVRKHGRLHPRCGTNFMMTVIIVGILVFTLFGWPTLGFRIFLRIIMLPVIAGISYEFIKWQGKSDSKIARSLSLPGLYLQKLTTREPDDSQIEVAIASLVAVLDEGEDDTW